MTGKKISAINNQQHTVQLELKSVGCKGKEIIIKIERCRSYYNQSIYFIFNSTTNPIMLSK